VGSIPIARSNKQPNCCVWKKYQKNENSVDI